MQQQYNFMRNQVPKNYNFMRDQTIKNYNFMRITKKASRIPRSERLSNL